MLSDDQIKDAEHVEPHSAPVVPLPGQPPGDERRGHPDGDVPQARRQREHGGQVAQGHRDQERHPHDPERVGQGEARRSAGVSEDAGHHGDLGGQQQRDEGSGNRHAEPGRGLSGISVVQDLSTRSVGCAPPSSVVSHPRTTPDLTASHRAVKPGGRRIRETEYVCPRKGGGP
jgi:hypothetical protein